MTDLDAFFAKKANKAKKKGVIKLEEISEQLERRAMEQKDETDDNENKPSEDPNSKNRPTGENNEDSEWLGFDDKPSVPMAIKEMADSYIESEDEEKRASAEPARTWKMNNEEIADNDAAVAKSEPAKYVVKAKKEAQLDLKSEEMFPSIEKAPEVEKKLKAQEEIERRTNLEERKLKEQEEKEREEKAKKDNLNRAMRRVADGESTRKQMDKEPTESDTTSNWRDMQKTIPKEEKEKPAKGTTAAHQLNAAKSSEVDSSWRSSKATGIVSSADSEGNWRKKDNPPAAPQQTVQTPQTQTQPAPGGGKYIPPHLKRQMEANRTD